MHQSSRLQSVVPTLTLQVVGRQSPQFGIEKRHPFRQGFRIFGTGLRGARRVSRCSVQGPLLSRSQHHARGGVIVAQTNSRLQSRRAEETSPVISEAPKVYPSPATIGTPIRSRSLQSAESCNPCVAYRLRRARSSNERFPWQYRYVFARCHKNNSAPGEPFADAFPRYLNTSAIERKRVCNSVRWRNR